jgi:hypothetical protein
MKKNSPEAAFHKELLALCVKHKLVAVPSDNFKPCAHDPMLIIPLNKDWKDYLKNRVYSYQEIVEELEE